MRQVHRGLSLAPAGLIVERLEQAAGEVVAIARSTSRGSDCPSCGSELERVQSESFAIDICRECRGVWFDNMDLSQVWKLEFNHSDEAKALTKESDTEDTVLAILRHSSTDADADGSRNVFGTIAGIVGGIFAPTGS